MPKNLAFLKKQDWVEENREAKSDSSLAVILELESKKKTADLS